METFPGSSCTSASEFLPSTFLAPPAPSLQPVLDSLGGQQESFRNFLPPLRYVPVPGLGIAPGTMSQIPCNMIFKGKEQGPDEMKTCDDMPSAFNFLYRTTDEMESSAASDKQFQLNGICNIDRVCCGTRHKGSDFHINRQCNFTINMKK
jgi:hypothetical protein